MNNIYGINSIKLPDGYFVKNSSKPILKYNHVLDGQGFLNVFKFRNNKITYKGIRIETYNYKKEKNANKQLYRGIGSNTDNFISNLFINNFSNVSVFHDKIANKVYSVGEGGIPYEIDLENGTTLESMKLNNIPRFFTERVPYLPITAHPTILNNNVYNMSCFMYGLNIYINNKFVKIIVFPKDEQYYFHDFKVTDNYFIVFLNSIKFNVHNAYFSNKTILDSMDFGDCSKILIIDKNNYSAKYYDINCNSMHIAHVIENKNELDMFLPLANKMNLKNTVNPYDFNGFNLHNIKINLIDNILIKKKLTDISAEMPSYHNNSIISINKHQLLKYNILFQKLDVLNFDGILEEPVIYNDNIFLIIHERNLSTSLKIYDFNTLNMLHELNILEQISYGFHGTFIPIDKNNNILTNY